MEVKISTTAPDDQNGTITYLKGFPNMQSATGGELKGVFAFSFYTSPTEPFAFWEHYMKGIQTYVDIVKMKEILTYDHNNPYQAENGSWYSTLKEKKSNPFFGWKVVIYTDKQTYKYLETLQHRIGFLKDEEVEFAIINWPYYDRENKGEVNGDVLRIMRFRAFFDFNKVPVFVRDADTIWVPLSGKKEFNGNVDTIVEWEANFYEGGKKQTKPYIFATSVNYKRKWHPNTLTQLEAPMGAFAGVQSAFPGAPCFETLTLWDKAVDYILTRSSYSLTEKQYKNKKSIGKDEQILLYVFLPACLNSIFFFELYMNPFPGNKEEPTEEEMEVHKFVMDVIKKKTFDKEEYPLFIFSGEEKAVRLEDFFRTIFTAFLTENKLAGGGRKTRKQKKKKKKKEPKRNWSRRNLK